MLAGMKAKDPRGQRPGTVINDYSEPKVYPSGRKANLTRPFSPWQKLVEERMIEHELSLRDLASKVSTKTEPFGFTRLFNWLHHIDGYPSSKSYSPQINTRLARALGLDPHKLAEAYEASRKHFASVDPAPPSREALTLIKEVRGKRKASYTKAEVIDLLQRLTRDS